MVRPAIMGYSEPSGVGLSQLNEDPPWKDYVDGLVDIFMDWWDRSGPRGGLVMPS